MPHPPSEHVLIGGGDVDLGKLGRQQPGEKQVVVLDDPERSIRDAEPVHQDFGQHAGIAVRGQADNLALVAPGLEAKRGGHRLVERAERVRVFERVDALQLPASTDAHAAGEPGAVPVEADHDRFVEAAVVVGVGGVRAVVLHPLQLAAEIELAQRRFQILVPAPMKGRRFTSPSARAALGDVAGHDPFVAEHLIRERLEQALLQPFVRILQTRHRRPF